MIGMFFRWYDKQLTKAKRDNKKMDDTAELVVQERSRIASNGTNFTLYQANGGTVLELRHYDRKNDDNIYTLYVIPSDRDLGVEISHIITMESLKR